MAATRPLRGSRNRNRRNFSLGEVGGGRGGAGRSGMFGKTFAQARYPILLYGNERFFSFFIETKKIQVLNGALLCSRVGIKYTIKYLIFVLCHK